MDGSFYSSWPKKITKSVILFLTYHQFSDIIIIDTGKAFKKEDGKMKGTEKQIRWAEDIKESVYGAFGCMERNAARDIDGVLQLGYNQADIDAVKAVVIPQIEAMDAAQIIDFRSRLNQSFFEEMAKKHNKEGF